MEALADVAEIKRVLADGSTYSVAAGTTDLTGSSVDTKGYDHLTLMIGFGAITSGAVTSIKAQGSAAPDSGQADIAGTAQTVLDSDDNKVFVVEIDRPVTRYVNTFIDRGTQNAVVDFVMAILRKGRVQPVAQGATIGGVERFSSPAAGTA